MSNPEQKHPREESDRAIVDTLLQGDPSDKNLLELARLLIRYQNFPGARNIQQDLASVLRMWQMNAEEVYQKTRQIYHSTSCDRQQKTAGETKEDWT